MRIAKPRVDGAYLILPFAKLRRGERTRQLIRTIKGVPPAGAPVWIHGTSTAGLAVSTPIDLVRVRLADRT
jgi:hypothetical protein